MRISNIRNVNEGIRSNKKGLLLMNTYIVCYIMFLYKSV